jgi:cytochrome c biogenesis protein CcmG/thiol:disulfide interchange protein DsbE
MTMSPAPSATSKKPPWLWIGLVVIVAVALGIAVWSTSGDDTSVSQGTTGAGGAISSAAETQPVTIVGEALPMLPNSGTDPAIGMTVPTLKGFHFDGSPMEIAPGGHAKMVVFLAHWCPHCNREIPVLQSWADAGGVPADLDIIGVSTAVNAQRENYPPSRWIVDKAWTWPVLADSANSDALTAYGLGRFPSFVIVGADGTVKARSGGELPSAALDALVTQALAT